MPLPDPCCSPAQNDAVHPFPSGGADGVIVGKYLNLEIVVKHEA